MILEVRDNFGQTTMLYLNQFEVNAPLPPDVFVFNAAERRRRRPAVMSTGGDLFGGPPAHAPLAELLRPQTLDEVIGQTHLLGPGKPLRLAFESGTPHSMILWGPPGVGKTTLARLMADAFDAEFIALSAVFSGVKDIREAVEQAELTLAQSGRRTMLFVDEVHRFNKAQQDAFLPYRRTRPADLHRRHHREPVVRGEFGAAVARRRCMC